MILPNRADANIATVASVVFTGLSAIELMSFLLTTSVIIISIVVNVLAFRNKKQERKLNEINIKIATKKLQNLTDESKS
jgi:hypothetical protein